MTEGLDLDGRAILLPSPVLNDDESEERQTDILRELTGSERALEQFLRDSLSAPFILRMEDQKGRDAIVRQGGLYFALHADLDEMMPGEITLLPAEGRFEFANMAVEAMVITEKELDGADKIRWQEGERLIHATVMVLDRISVRTTFEILTSKSANSLIIAAKPSSRFGSKGRFANLWRAIDRHARDEGEAHAYPGGIFYLKATRLKGFADALLVEVHFAILEPKAWFDGAPVLRSKFGLIAQNTIRSLRRRLR